MKNKIVGGLLFLIAALSVMWFMGVFNRGEATQEDHKAGEEVVKELEDVYDNVEMPDFEKDTIELEDDEEFDPEAML